MKQRILLSISGVLFCLLFANALFIDYDLIVKEFDWKIITFNIIACIFIVFSAVLLVKKSIDIGISEILIFLFTFYVALNYCLKIPGSNNFLISIVLISFIVLVSKQLIVSFDKKDVLINYFTISFLLVGICESLLGIAQLFNFVGRPAAYASGTFNNSGIYAQYIGATFCFSFAYYVFSANSTGNKAIKNLCILNLLAGIILLPSTNSRTTWLAIIASIVLVTILLIRKKSSFLKLNWYFLPVVIVAVIGLFWLYNLKKDSADGRLVIWKTGLIAVKDNAATGIGFDQLQNKFADYQMKYFEANPDDAVKFTDKVNYAFNDILHIVVENGIIGGLLFSAFVLYLVILVFKKINADPMVMAAIAGAFCLVLGGMFSYPFEIISTRFLFFFFVIVIITRLRADKTFEINKLFSSLAYLLMICFCLYSLFQQYNTIRSKSYLREAQLAINDESFIKAKMNYERALAYVPSQKRILLGYGLALLNTKEYNQSIKVFLNADRYISDPYLSTNLGVAYDTTGNYVEAEKQSIKAIRMMPNRMYFKYRLAKMYIKSGDTLKAKAIANQILVMPVKVQSLATREMTEEMNLFLNNK